jgi:hypothetical protein
VNSQEAEEDVEMLEVLDTVTSIETEDEARNLLNLANAERETRRIEKSLADSRVEKTILRMQLYQSEAKKATRKLQQAEYEVGRVRNTLRNCKFSGVVNIIHHCSVPRTRIEGEALHPVYSLVPVY